RHGTALAVAWPRGEAAACKAVYTGSNPVATSDGRQQCRLTSAIGAAVARFLHTEEVTGSIPVSRTGTTRFRCNNRIERDWRSGSALPSHGRGHWFDPSIAHRDHTVPVQQQNRARLAQR